MPSCVLGQDTLGCLLLWVVRKVIAKKVQRCSLVVRALGW